MKNMDLDDEIKEVCDFIKAQRKKRGLSQLDLALNANVSQSLIAAFENHKKRPSIEVLIRLVHSMNMSSLKEFFKIMPDETGKASLEYDFKKRAIKAIEDL